MTLILSLIFSFIMGQMIRKLGHCFEGLLSRRVTNRREDRICSLHIQK